MRRLLRIARTEVLEHRRQPWMIFILAANYLLLISVFGLTFLVTDTIARSPKLHGPFVEQMARLGIQYDAFLQAATSTFSSVAFTNMPFFVALMCGTSVLHDRACGTMPFLMLAPVSRLQLLVGKLAGAMAVPLVLHLVFVGTSSLLLGRLEVLAPFAQKVGAAPAWWLAFLLGAPASTAFVGAVGTVISALSRDVRTSIQVTSFVVAVLSLGIGAVLVHGLSRGVLLQLGFAALCLVAAAGTLSLGARLISTDPMA